MYPTFSKQTTMRTAINLVMKGESKNLIFFGVKNIFPDKCII